MSIKALVFAIIGFVVFGFYALESYLTFHSGAFGAPLIVKLAICAAGLYFFIRNVRRIKGGSSGGPSANAP